MSFWARLDTALAYSIGGAISLSGMYAIYFFTVRQVLSGGHPDVEEVIIAFGIFSIGACIVAYARIKMKSILWISCANASFWFFLLDIVFVTKQLVADLPTSLHTILHTVGTLGLIVIFLRLAYVTRKREKRGISRNAG